MFVAKPRGIINRNTWQKIKSTVVKNIIARHIINKKIHIQTRYEYIDKRHHRTICIEFDDVAFNMTERYSISQ